MQLWVNLSLYALISLISAAASAGSDKPEADAGQNSAVFSEDFDGFFRSSEASTLHHLELASIVFNEGTDASKALKVYYQGYDRGSKRVVKTLPLPQAMTSATLSFAVKFCEGFDFAKGGKLHGFAPSNPVTGGAPIKPDGWSVRAMWGKNGQLKTYVYHQGMKGKYGDAKPAPTFRFKPGRYYQLSYQLTLNQPASASNGEFSLWVDGERVVTHSGLQLRASDDPSTLIRQFMFNTFHGGSAPEWAPRDASGNYKRDCAYFDDIRITP
ncbi:polysaccharide lyase [Idiomarina aquatica]|uniref:Polysaccharide lyase 14 domain-containing protein n=1 Tax=Idiomarina aquatica TaxID=1327752 RepID=A0AA94EHG1_9GAMM|nr:hypothetical protein [Idiomarina aquatica]RUO45178.1 hypothetical protein CWE23_03925 [Idiomarina aquatica]